MMRRRWLPLGLSALLLAVACSKDTAVNVENAGDEACGGLVDGEVVCTDDSLQVCNSLGPGLREIERCDSADICEASIPASERYDEGDPPTCIVGCEASAHYCDGATLLQCRDDGTGPVDEGAECASSGLCEQALAADPVACPDVACASGEARCAGGHTELITETCSADQSGFDLADTCTGATAQCNPANGDCIALDVDATEVTQADYAAFLATSPATDGQPARCAFNDSFEPDATCLTDPSVCTGAGCDSHPQVCVDWCDAYAYCQAQGRRLCGRISGGMTPYDRHDDAGSSAWMNACSAAGQFVYAPDEAPQSGADQCTFDGTQIGTTYEVGARAACTSPSPGYAACFDLSGNVAEWEDSCSEPADSSASGTGADDACHTRGGAFDSAREDTACAAVPVVPATRGATEPNLGFRCCGS